MLVPTIIIIMQDIQVFCNTFDFVNKALPKEIMKRTKVKNKTNKYSCSGPPAFKSGSCRLRFS